MKRRPLYFLLLLLPLLVVSAVVILNSIQGYRQFNARQIDAARVLSAHLVPLTEMTKLNQELTAVHRKADLALVGAGAGTLDQAAAYRTHAEVVDRLAAAEVALRRILATLPVLEDKQQASPQRMLKEQGENALKDFIAYRNLIVQATDIAAVDSQQATKSLYQAANAYLEFSLHSHRVAVHVSDAVLEWQRNIASQRRRLFLIQGAESAAVLALTLLAWLFVIIYVTRRADLIVQALHALGQGEVQDRLLTRVGVLSRQPTMFGAIAKSLLAFRDAIMAQAEAQRTIAEERGRLRTIINAIPDLVSFKDTEGRYLDCNVRYESFLGLEREQILGKRNTDFLQQDLRALALGKDQEVMATGQANQFTAWHTFALDHHQEFMEVTKTPMFGPDGSLLNILTVCRDLTPIHLAQKGFIEAQRFLVRAQAIAKTGSWSIDLPDGATRASAEACRILGLADRTELPRELIAGLVHPEDRDRILKSWADLRQGLPYDLEHRIVVDGEVKWLHSLAETERDSDGRLVRLVGTLQDVTMLKRSETELKTLSLAVDQSPSTVVITDLEARIKYVNEAFTRSTGYTLEEVADRNPRFLQSGKTPGTTYAAMWAALGRGESWTGEFINLRKDGSEQIEAAHVLPLRDAEGKITRYMALKEDVTEQKRSDELLLKLSLAVAQSPESIVITNLDAQIEYVNAAFERATGYSREEALGLNPRVLQSGKTPKETFQNMWEHLTRGVPWKGELINKRKDGSEYVELAIIAPIRQPDGRTTHFLAIKDDITEKKRIAQELDSYRHHLEDEVSIRTAELASAKLQAEDANQAKSAFLANMSHEIRTPMNAIIGLTYLLKRDSASLDQRQQLDKITQAANHLLAVINDILDFSKIEAGKMTLDPHDFEVEQVIGNACTLVADKAEAKNLELVADIVGLPPMLHGDGLRLGQILLNMLSNAIKFTERGSIVLRGKVLHGESAQVWVRLEVQDTGIGMTPEQQDRIFHAFEQADTSTTRSYGGTGLGLAISKRFAELMGGRLGVQSEPGLGSTFWLEAPFGAPASPPRSRSFKGFPKGTRVLVVDDMEEARALLHDILSTLGARTDLADSGADALQMIGKADALGDPYRLVLMDWKMPGLSGTETSQALADLPLKVRPVCFLVSGTTGCPRNQLQDFGFRAFMPKPVTPNLLLSTLAEVFDELSKPSTTPSDLKGEQLEAELRLRSPGRRLLLVEDNPLNQEVALDLLRHVGLSADLAEDGLQAVRMAQEQAYELILMDVQMPNLDGLGATRAIRLSSAQPAVPILAMTANAFEEDRVAVLEAGMNDHITKPIDPDTFYASLLQWLPGSPAAPEAGPERPTAAEPSLAAEALWRARLATIPGLDLEKGLRVLKGNVPKLGEMLTRFARDHRSDATLIRESLLAADEGKARLLVHTLKGVAATFGLTGLQEAATRFESARHPNLLTELEQCLEAVCEALASLEVQKPQAGIALDLAGLQAQLDGLRVLLAADELESVRVFEQLLPGLQAVFGEKVRQLEASVLEYEFDKALQTLDAWRLDGGLNP